MTRPPPSLHLVNDAFPSLATRMRETPELARIRDLVTQASDSLATSEKLARAGLDLVHAAQARNPSKAIESVGAWLSDHLDAVRDGEDPYPRARDLHEAVLAAADELDSACGRNGAKWRETYNTVLGTLDPNLKTESPVTPPNHWLTRMSAVPNYAWVIALVGLLGIAGGYFLARKGKH